MSSARRSSTTTGSSPTNNKRRFSTSASNKGGPTLPPIFTSASVGAAQSGGVGVGLGGGHDQPAEEQLLDAMIGTGTGTAASVLARGSGNNRSSSLVPVQHPSSSQGAVVDYMTFAEAPAFFDLPIPMFATATKSNSSNNNNAKKSPQQRKNSNRRRSSLFNEGGFDSGDFNNDNIMSSSFDGSNNNNNNLSSPGKAGGDDDDDAAQHQSQFLQPLREFNTGQQLRWLEQSSAFKDNSNNNANSNSDYYGHLHKKNNNKASSSSSSNSKNNKSRRSGNKKSSRGNNSDDYVAQSSRVVLPKSIADMVQSLRPTHYAPLRKAMRTRSQERIYEGDDDGQPNKKKEPDAETKRRQELLEQKKRDDLQLNVGRWQTQQQDIVSVENETAALTLHVPHHSAQRKSGFHVSMLDIARDGREDLNDDNDQHHQSWSSPRRTSPLSTVHAGRRVSILTAQMVGDLGQPSRGPLPTHGNMTDMLESESSGRGGGGEHGYLDIGGGGGGVDPATGMLLGASTLSEPTSQLANVSPHRKSVLMHSSKPRLSVSVAAEEQSHNANKTEEFHRDILAWYRTEATMLRVAM